VGELSEVSEVRQLSVFSWVPLIIALALVRFKRVELKSMGQD
jgi:hypothetical protein